MNKYWIKLFLKILDDVKFGLLPEFQKWRAIELSLAAGENGNDGLLPPVERLAWRLRLPQEKLEETLSVLSQAGVVHETPQGWVVTDFEKQQAAMTATERSRYFRRRSDYATKRCKNRNEVAAVLSTSTSDSNSDSESDSDSNFESDSDSQEKERVHPEVTGAGGEEEPLAIPESPAQAMLHPDVQVFAAVTGGRIPGLSQYRAVIESIRLLRAREKLNDAALVILLKPYWLAWSVRKRQDGRPYDPGSLVWLVEWALNKSVPPPGGAKAAQSPSRVGVPSPEETLRMLDERDKMIKQAVPPPPELLAKIRGLRGKLDASRAPETLRGTPLPGETKPPGGGPSPPDR